MLFKFVNEIETSFFTFNIGNVFEFDSGWVLLFDIVILFVLLFCLLFLDEEQQTPIFLFIIKYLIFY